MKFLFGWKRIRVWFLFSFLVVCTISSLYGMDIVIGKPDFSFSGEVQIPLCLKIKENECPTCASMELEYNPDLITFQKIQMQKCLIQQEKIIQVHQVKPGRIRVIIYGLNQNKFPSGKIAVVCFKRKNLFFKGIIFLKIRKIKGCSGESNKLPVSGKSRKRNLNCTSFPRDVLAKDKLFIGLFIFMLGSVSIIFGLKGKKPKTIFCGEVYKSRWVSWSFLKARDRPPPFGKNKLFSIYLTKISLSWNYYLSKSPLNIKTKFNGLIYIPNLSQFKQYFFSFNKKSFLVFLIGGITGFVWAVEDVTNQTLNNSQALAELQQNGTIFFSDDFEDGDFNDWFDAYGPPEVINNSSQANSGDRVLKCLAEYKDNNSSTSSIKYWFHPGYEQVYYRWYCKFETDFNQGWGMHYCSLYAVQGDDKWSEMGGAGIKPDGDDRFGSGFEPWSHWESLLPPGRMQFYSYWHQMEPDIYDDDGDGIPDIHYWGNTFYPEPSFIPERGKWYCMEIMIKANDAGQDNGEMASWIDGQLYQHLKGFNWRTTDELKLKRISLGIYIHNNPKDNVVWFDDVALSTGYIGPLDYNPLSEDINNDGVVNIQDVQLCVNVILGSETNAEIVARADANDDGQINVLDVQTIANIILSQ